MYVCGTSMYICLGTEWKSATSPEAEPVRVEKKKRKNQSPKKKLEKEKIHEKNWKSYGRDTKELQASQMEQSQVKYNKEMVQEKTGGPNGRDTKELQASQMEQSQGKSNKVSKPSKSKREIWKGEDSRKKLGVLWKGYQGAASITGGAVSRKVKQSF